MLTEVRGKPFNSPLIKLLIIKFQKFESLKGSQEVVKGRRGEGSPHLDPISFGPVLKSKVATFCTVKT